MFNNIIMSESKNEIDYISNKKKIHNKKMQKKKNKKDKISESDQDTTILTFKRENMAPKGIVVIFIIIILLYLIYRVIKYFFLKFPLLFCNN